MVLNMLLIELLSIFDAWAPLSMTLRARHSSNTIGPSHLLRPSSRFVNVSRLAARTTLSGVRRIGTVYLRQAVLCLRARGSKPLTDPFLT
jgi:hypothetical protein